MVAAANDLTTFGMYGQLSDDNGAQVDNINVIPEPATIGLMGVFGVGLMLSRRRFKK